MSFAVCIFEDDTVSKLYPLTLTRPVFELRCGMFTLREKLMRQLSGRATFLMCRDYLKDWVQATNGACVVNRVDADRCLFVNGALLADDRINSLDTSREQLFTKNGRVAAAYLAGHHIKEFAEWISASNAPDHFEGASGLETPELTLINFSWDLVRENANEIARDFDSVGKGGVIDGIVSSAAILENEERIHLAKKAVIQSGVIVDATRGPVYIAENAVVRHHSVIEGPAYIGPSTMIKIGAKIYEGTSIGALCKVGGEVEESIVHAHSNKQHDGFLGHSYLGEWVNLGADTNTSDLKNNYGSVKVYVDGEMVDSGSAHVGLTMGDHSKAGINTMFNTGTVVGIMCNIFGGDFPPKFVSSYAWGGQAGFTEHELERAIATARAVMARRDQDLGPEYEHILRAVFESTGRERQNFLQRP